MNDLHPDDDLLLALALDDVDDSERETTLKHLSTCHRCRNEYDALSATVEQTLAAAPSVEPGPGFDARVLTAMGFDEAAPAQGRTRRTWRRWQLVAASVAVGLGLGAGGAVALQRINDSSRETLAQNSSYLETAAGERVGTVTPSFVEGEPVLVVTVTSGRVGMKYLCLLRLENGQQVASAEWVLEYERGATWVVKVPRTPVTEVELVANGGAGPVWSTARL